MFLWFPWLSQSAVAVLHYLKYLSVWGGGERSHKWANLQTACFSRSPLSLENNSLPPTIVFLVRPFSLEHKWWRLFCVKTFFVMHKWCFVRLTFFRWCVMTLPWYCCICIVDLLLNQFVLKYKDTVSSCFNKKRQALIRHYRWRNKWTLWGFPFRAMTVHSDSVIGLLFLILANSLVLSKQD